MEIINKRRCYISCKSGRPSLAAVVETSEGAYLLNRKKAWGTEELRDEFTAKFGGACGYGSVDGRACRLESATAEAVLAACAGSVSVVFEGSEEFAAIAAAAVRGGSSSSASAEDPAPVATSATAPATSAAVVAGSGSFVVPGVDVVPSLASALSALPVLIDTVNEYASGVGAAVVGGSELPVVPESVTAAGAFCPALLPSLEAYRIAIENAGREWLEAKRLEEEKRAAEAAAAEAAAAAAARGASVVTLADGSTVEVDGLPHKEFNRVALLAKFGQHVYLHGPAGTGKTTLCKQVASALGREFYSVAKVADEYQLSGFADANSNFVKTEVYRAVVNGGVLLVDEADASDPNALTWLNSGLANGFFTFPGVGRVEAAEGFTCIMTGNTIGRGASADYCGRNPLDGATLDRFGFVRVGYDYAVELALAGASPAEVAAARAAAGGSSKPCNGVGGVELVKFIHEVRRAAEASGVQCLATPRAIEAMNKCKQYFPACELIEMFLTKGLEKDQINLLSAECRGRGVWFDALKELAA